MDSVSAELTSLERTLPATDRSRLDRYLTDVREVERRIALATQQMPAGLKLPAAPSGMPDDFETHIKLMFDLQVLAWQADITRVSTLMFAKEVSNAVYPASGIRDPFHNLSHHSNVPDNIDEARAAAAVPRQDLRVPAAEAAGRRRTATARCSITRSCCTAAA